MDIIIVANMFVFMAGACNAVMDAVDHKFGKTIFSMINKKNIRKWFNEHQGWKNKYVDYDGDVKKGIKPRRVKWKVLGLKFNKPVQLTDSWHFFKMWSIFFYCLSAASAVVYSTKFVIGETILNLMVVVLIMGIVRNLGFTLFYRKILIK